jgi:hypothetical protein
MKMSECAPGERRANITYDIHWLRRGQALRQPRIPIRWRVTTPILLIDARCPSRLLLRLTPTRHTQAQPGAALNRVIARAIPKQPTNPIFDKAASSLDPTTAAHFAATINQLKGKVTMLFITRALPKNLLVDEVVRIGSATIVAVDAEALHRSGENQIATKPGSH